MTGGSILLHRKRADTPAVAEAADGVRADAARRADACRTGHDAGDAREPVDVIAAAISASVSPLRRRQTDVAVLPTAKRPHASPADPQANAFGLMARPDQTATGVAAEAPAFAGVTPAGRLQRPPVWRMQEIVLEVDGVTAELRRRLSEAPATDGTYGPKRLVLYATPLMLVGVSLMLWFGAETLFRGGW